MTRHVDLNVIGSITMSCVKQGAFIVAAFFVVKFLKSPRIPELVLGCALIVVVVACVECWDSCFCVDERVSFTCSHAQKLRFRAAFVADHDSEIEKN